MSELKKSDFRIFYGISFIFLIAVLYFLSKEQYWAAAFPLLAGIIIIALFSLDKLILSIAFFTRNKGVSIKVLRNTWASQDHQNAKEPGR